MKKLLESVGIFALLCVSFIYTEQTVTVVKEFDEIMIQIKDESEKSSIPSENALINKNTIIPGLAGREVDINLSYSKMKRYGKYNEKLLAYTKKKPDVSISNHMDKYIIGGNKNKNMVSLLFLVEENDSIKKILQILENKNIHATFFVDGFFVEKNSDTLIELVNKGHDLGNLSYAKNYSHHSYAWLDTKIKQVSKQKYGYCYSESENKTVPSICSMSSNYTIMPSLVITSYPLKTIKENIKAGDLVALPINDSIEEELAVIISFIESKGFVIAPLSEHLKEEKATS